MATPINTDLSTSNHVPGIYIKINTLGGAAADNAAKRVILAGTRLAAGAGAPDTPVLVTSQSEVNDAHGQGSEVARLYAAFQSQYGAGEFETWVAGVAEPSGGTAATALIVTAGAATEAGYVDVYVCGYRVSVGITSGDTAATVGAAIVAAINLVGDLPVTAAGTTTATLTYRHKGLSGNDLPVRVDQFGASGLTFSPGTLTFANNAGGNYTHTLTVGATTVTTAITTGNTPTQAGNKVVTSLAAGDYPVTASNNVGTLTLLYRKGRTVRKFARDMGGELTQTATLATGTTGAGVPTVATLLSTISAMSQGFAAWVHTWTDPAGADSTVNDLIYDAIQVDTNGVNMKPAYVFLGSAAKLSTAGAVITVASPALTTTSPFARFNLSWCREAPVQAFEVAARHAAAYLKPDYYAQNLDGTVLSTRGTVPLLNPAVADRPPLADIQAAIGSYYMSPIVVDAQGNLAVLTSKTTSNASNQILRESSTIRQTDTARESLRVWLQSKFAGKSYRASTPKTTNTVTTGSVKVATYVWARQLDDQDLFDDAAAFKDAITCNVNQQNATRFDLFVPLAVILPLHQIGAVIQPE